MVINYGELYLYARNKLQSTEEPQTAAMIARDLVCTFSGMKPEEFLLQKNTEAPEEVCQKVSSGVFRLQKGEPLAYVLEEWEFYGIPLHVNKDVLIPRDDTCAVTELAVSKGLFLETDPRILDVCCGSGCIGIAVASRLKDARVTLGDVSKEALAVSKKNIARNKLGGRMTCVQLDVNEPAPGFLGKFDMIVSNPPYVTAAEMQELPESVRDYEPHLALCGGEDGLDFYRAIVRNYTSCLKPEGYLCFEFGMNQGDSVCRILEDGGYTILERTLDYNGRERAVLAQHGGKGN